MELHLKQQEILMRKINRRREEIRGYTVSDRTPITDIALRETADYESYAEATKVDDYCPIGVGEEWGGNCNGWFRIRFTVPKEWAGKTVTSFFDFGAEACAYLNGEPRQGIDRHHPEMLLIQSAKGGEEFEIIVDAISGHAWTPDAPGKKSCLSRAEIATRNIEVENYYFTLETLCLLADALPQDSTRRQRIIYHLNKSVDAFDYTHTDEASLRESATRALELLKPVVECPAEASATNLAVHGHSHIDVAWLWPYRETMRKCARTFSTVMRMIEQYPEYLFSQSQAQLYQFVKENYPSLYKEIREQVKAGRWDVTGSMWVEADCNLSSGESLVRQVLLGKNFFIDEFGIETDVLWLPDVFGYSAALPQILSKSRVPYFSTIKIGWGQFNKFPYSTFHWSGIDGTSVLAHFPPSGDYNAYPEARKLRYQVEAFREKDRSDWSLQSYGWGDGGGGPDRRHLELLSRSRDLEGLPRCIQTKVTDFFHKIDDETDYPNWKGELYLEYHRGTYTTQARNKKLNRKAELLYRDAELLSVIGRSLGVEYPYAELDREWKKILCNQFHDVIPGTSIRAVYEDTDRMYSEVFETGRAIVDKALSALAARIDTSGDGEAVLVMNTLPWERRDIACIEPPSSSDVSIVDPDGCVIPSQVIGGPRPGEAQRLVFEAEAPSMGYATYRLVENDTQRLESPVTATTDGLENAFYRLSIDANGLLSSVVEKRSGRELLPRDARANVFGMFEDKPIDWPAWDIDFYYEDKGVDLTECRSVRVVENGPVCAGVEITREFGESKIVQIVRLYAGVARIDFVTWIDWRERQKLLKVNFPLEINSDKARYEIQFGNVERATHRNTSWDFARFEVCAHKWADVSEGGFGVSLLNDCKYGHSAVQGSLSLTLLRSAREPDPMADLGEHEFTYSLMPHSGDYAAAGTVRAGYSLNVPLSALRTSPHAGDLAARRSYAEVDAPNVILETVKRAERSEAVILRFYECHNRRSRVRVKLDMPFETVTECDLMEDAVGEPRQYEAGFEFDIKPFEIKTFALSREGAVA